MSPLWVGPTNFIRHPLLHTTTHCTTLQTHCGPTHGSPLWVGPTNYIRHPNSQTYCNPKLLRERYLTSTLHKHIIEMNWQFMNVCEHWSLFMSDIGLFCVEYRSLLMSDTTYHSNELTFHEWSPPLLPMSFFAGVYEYLHVTSSKETYINTQKSHTLTHKRDNHQHTKETYFNEYLSVTPRTI